jgi:hypothetical protein
MTWIKRETPCAPVKATRPFSGLSVRGRRLAVGKPPMVVSAVDLVVVSGGHFVAICPKTVKMNGILGKQAGYQFICPLNSME